MLRLEPIYCLRNLEVEKRNRGISNRFLFRLFFSCFVHHLHSKLQFKGFLLSCERVCVCVYFCFCNFFLSLLLLPDSRRYFCFSFSFQVKQKHIFACCCLLSEFVVIVRRFLLLLLLLSLQLMEFNEMCILQSNWHTNTTWWYANENLVHGLKSYTVLHIHSMCVCVYVWIIFSPLYVN